VPRRDRYVIDVDDGSRGERASLSNTGVLVITEMIIRNDNRSVFID